MAVAARANAQGSVVARYALSDRERTEVESLLDGLADRHDSVEDPELLDLAPTDARELPRGLRVFLNEFRLAEEAAVCVVSGWHVADERLGPTPGHWRERPVPSPALREELLLERVNVARDLRRSRASLGGVRSRVVR